MTLRDYESWFEKGDIRPYVYMRKTNLPSRPGTKHRFHFQVPILHKDPALWKEAPFAYQILKLENTVFAKSGLTLPRWALYDCAVMPGLIVGFACKREKLPKSAHKVLSIDPSLEWVPISLFIAIPTLQKDHWVANNLCSINSLIPKEEQFPGLGFLSKVFGLWYGNIEWLYGITQWKNPALKVHTHYGSFQLETAYTPIHDITTTLTYKVNVDVQYWNHFLGDQADLDAGLVYAGITVDPKKEEDAKALQERIESGEGPYFLHGGEVALKGTHQYRIFRRK